MFAFFFFKQKTAYEMRISDWSSDVCSSDLQFMQAMIDFNASQGKPVYPDANSSLRITFGTVRGYSPRDAVQMMPFTTLAGIVDKDTGVEPFDAPKAQLEAIAAGKGAQYRMESLGDVPVNFLSEDRKSTRLNSSH